VSTTGLTEPLKWITHYIFDDSCGSTIAANFRPLTFGRLLAQVHHEVGFLHEFVDQMGTFPWFHVWTPFRRLGLPATLLTQPSLPFRLLDIFQEGTHLCQARAHPLP
jgi:hypothetical protein